MTTPFLLAATALVVVIVGVLIMTQLLGLDQLGAAIWRVLAFLWAVIVTCVLLRWFLLPILICALVLLKAVILSALMIVILTIALLILLRIVLLKGASRTKGHETKEE
jgi:hypothetical protein